ncbi:MAG: hypothetical protein IIZ54_03150 [Selenomonadaceae bacterium]|nr:hypothetical protein [Selenomonadaceae bacterium]
MKLPRSVLYIFVILMGICTLILIWQVPASTSMEFSISEARLSLETAQGRERKQQSEYDRTLENIQAAKECGFQAILFEGYDKTYPAVMELAWDEQVK